MVQDNLSVWVGLFKDISLKLLKETCIWCRFFWQKVTVVKQSKLWCSSVLQSTEGLLNSSSALCHKNSFLFMTCTTWISVNVTVTGVKNSHYTSIKLYNFSLISGPVCLYRSHGGISIKSTLLQSLKCGVRSRRS